MITLYMLDFIKYIQGFASPALDLFLTIFNLFSQQYFLVLLVAVVYWTIDKRKGEQLSFALIFTTCISCGIKGVFKVSRPYNYEGIRVLNKHTAPGYSFPSADSSAASSVASTFSLWTRKPYLWVLLGIYVLVIGFSRMYFGLHFPTDVAGGIIIGAVIAYGINKILSVVKDTLKLYTVAGLLLLLFVFFGQEPDYYKTMGLMLGAVCGIMIEHKFVNFTCNIPRSRKALRLIIGICSVIAIAVISKFLFPEGNLFYLIEKFLLTFFAVGIYPFIFTRLKF